MMKKATLVAIIFAFMIGITANVDASSSYSSEEIEKSSKNAGRILSIEELKKICSKEDMSCILDYCAMFQEEYLEAFKKADSIAKGDKEDHLNTYLLLLEPISEDIIKKSTRKDRDIISRWFGMKGVTEATLGEDISPAGWELVAAALKCDSHLARLNINCYTSMPFAIIAKSLKYNGTLKVLSLSGDITESHILGLGKALSKNQTLKHVILDHITGGVTERIGQSIARMLKMASSLAELSLVNSEIRDGSVATMLRCRITKTSATTLNLSNNHLRNFDIESMMSVLYISPYLKVLNLSDNDIDDDGAIMLGGILEVNDSLGTLDLSKNHISITGAMALIRALSVSNSLKTLILSGNGINREQIQRIQDMMKALSIKTERVRFF